MPSTYLVLQLPRCRFGEHFNPCRCDVRVQNLRLTDRVLLHPQWPDRNNRAIGTQCGLQVRKIYLQSVWPDHPNRTHGTTTSLGQSAYEYVPSTCGDNDDRVPGFTRQKNQPHAIDVPYRFQLDTRQRHFTCQLFPGLGSGWTSGLDDLYRRRCGDVYVRSHRPTKIGHLPETGVRRSNVLLRCQSARS